MNGPKVAGVTLPLFSIRTDHDWGIGQLTDLPACAAWLRRSGHRLLQILPPHELSGGETSPYGALTAFGVDPVYVGLEAIVDLAGLGPEELVGADGARTLQAARASRKVEYALVRELKARALHVAFERFVATDWEKGSARAASLRAFVDAERSWLHDLAVYTVLREDHHGHGWETWPDGERDRAPLAIERGDKTFARRLLEVGYQQWTVLEQWTAAKAELGRLGVELMGDLPFVVCSESADVWSRAAQFQRHLSLGAPPDGFSPDGQDWGLPPYDWLAMEADDLAWVRARARHAARLYDGFRLDHVVGYFRQWVKQPGPGQRGRFDPDGPDAQNARGRRALGAILEESRLGPSPARVVAEDLGVIPPFVRHALAELETPGYRVIPWEKDGHVFRDPAHFPARSVATWSTHDTAPITAWWDDFDDGEREQLTRLTGLSGHESPSERSLVLLRALFRSGSEVTLVLAQELTDERTRINTPGTVGGENWTYRLPRPIAELEADPALGARFDAVRVMVEESGRR